jgi:hypothetical protein
MPISAALLYLLTQRLFDSGGEPIAPEGDYARST